MALAPILIPILAPAPDKVPWMLMVIAIVSTACTIPTVFLPGRPKIPSSPSSDQERMPFMEGVKCLAKNKMFLWVNMLCAVNSGMVFSVSTLIMEAISPIGYSEKESGWCAAAIVIAGFAGGIVAGYWAGKTAQHVMLIKIFTPIMVFTYFTLIFESKDRKSALGKVRD